MRRAIAILTFVAAAAASRSAAAETCPPSANDFATWTWQDAAASGDAWLSAVWCGAPGAPLPSRDDVHMMAVEQMGLVPYYAHDWAGLFESADLCDPDSWGGRFLNGAFATELVGWHRDQDTLEQPYSPGATMPEGDVVTRWLSRFVRYYTRDNGWKPYCLAAGDAAGPNDGFTFAANPTDDAPLKLYFPWFWNMNVIDRASVLVHEAAHEFAGHLSDDACTNGASCDDAYGNNNAQTFQLVFQAQAIDAYRRAGETRDLDIVNYGNDVCGYVPLVPDQQRWQLVWIMRSRMQTVFQSPPPESQYPASAFIDDAAGSVYDLADEPGGFPGRAYRIDIANGARWPCAAVCDPAAYVFSADTGGGPRACNELYQPENVEVNAHNRALCEALNAEVAAGVSAKEHAELKKRLIFETRKCVPGVTPEYVAGVCQALSAAADHVSDIEAGWSIPDLGWYFDAEAAIRACQQSFCAARHDASWDAVGAEACYEWDDATGCLELACGELDALAAAHGRDSYEFFEAVVCRASALGRDIAGLSETHTGCDAKFDECVIRERYLPAWIEQIGGGACWATATGVSPGDDPLHVAVRDAIGTLSAERFLVLDRAAGLLGSRCTFERTACEAQQAALQAALAKMLREKARTRPVWQRQPLPDPWERLTGRYDREVLEAMVALGARVGDPATRPAALARDADLRRLAATPEARVAVAELVGRDVFFAAGGERFADGVFAPATLRRFTGERPARDPYALPVDGFEPELAALGSLHRRLDESEALFAAAPGLSGAAAYRHLVALLEAPDAVALGRAFDAFAAEVGALGR